MKKRVLIILLVVTLLICGHHAYKVAAMGWHGIRGSGHLVEEKREVNGINGVDLATMGTLYIKTGEMESLLIEAEDNLLEYIETRVKNGMLRIDSTWNVSLRPTLRINYHLTVTDLDTIRISSSGDVYAQIPDLEVGRFSVNISSSGNLDMGDLQADSLKVNISSSGDMSMGELQADSLTVRISSSGNVEIDELYADSLRANISSYGDLDIEGGKVDWQDIKISSSGMYNAKRLESVEADVNLSSSGSAVIRVSDKLRASLSSSGDVHYIGDPTVNARTSSSGDVEKIGE